MKKAMIMLVGIAVAVVLAVVLWPGEGEPTSTPLPEPPAGAKPGEKVSVDGKGYVVESQSVDGETKLVLVPLAETPSLTRRPLEPEATKRLHEGPATITSVFETSGKAEYAQYGQRTRGAYYYMTTVLARSEVLEKEEGKDGSVRVVERRKFLQARDHLALSDLDVALDLSTLPVKETQRYVNAVCGVVAGISVLCGWAPVAAGAEVAAQRANAAFELLYLLDGTSARQLLGDFGVEVPESLEKYFNERVSEWTKGKIAPVHAALQSIEGKSYIITYTQEESGKPLNVGFRHEADEPITATELEILQSANVFLDSQVIPDTQLKVGDTWTVWADEVQELFGAAGDAEVDGKIRVKREADQDNGDWTLQLEPSEITCRGEGGRGKLAVKGGNGSVDAENAFVKTLQATATGDLRMLDKTRHWMLFEFVKKTEGDAAMRFTLSVEPAPQEP